MATQFNFAETIIWVFFQFYLNNKVKKDRKKNKREIISKLAL